MRTLSLVTLAACVPPTEEALEWGLVDGSDVLVERPGEAFSERVQPLGVPAARLLPDGPLLRLDRGLPFPLPALVVVDPTPWPRVVVEARDLDVLVYVERLDLEPRVVRSVDGTGPDGDGSVRFRTGTPVERIDEDDDRVQVHADLDELDVYAWLPRSAVDEVWSADDEAPDDDPLAEGDPRRLIAGAVVLDRPGGDVLAAYQRGHVPVVITGESERGYAPVAIDRRDVRIHGYVHEDDLSSHEWIGLGGFGTGSGWSSQTTSCGWGPTATVPRGTLLHAGPDGPIVARASRDIGVELTARDEGALIERTTPLGSVAVWADPADVR